MKSLDYYIRERRFVRALPFVRKGDLVLDVGCDDGALFERVRGIIEEGVGVDPILPQIHHEDFYTLYPGVFPDAVPSNKKFDVILFLAVLEHLPASELLAIGSQCHNFLNPGGRVVITVPSPQVDKILDAMKFLRLLDGMSLEEHHGFEASQTARYFDSALFGQIHREKFQMGLNNLFVFQRLEVNSLEGARSSHTKSSSSDAA